MKRVAATAVLLFAVLARARVDDDRFPTVPTRRGPSDSVCIETAERSADLVFTSPARTDGSATRDIPFWHLIAYDYDGTVVRVLGFMHGERDRRALYGSFEQAIDYARDHHPEDVSRLSLPLVRSFAETLTRLHTSGACARVEGKVAIQPRDHRAAVNGEFVQVLRVEVWLIP